MANSSTVKVRGADRWLFPLHRWVWADPHRRAHKLLRFAETEADGGRDLARAAELTNDALLRRLYLRHALDEQRHADLFRQRGKAMLLSLRQNEGTPVGASSVQANWLSPGERGLDDLRVEKENDHSLLAFLHLSERAAAMRFAVYHDVLTIDPETRAVFGEILKDEAFHMNYTHTQLRRIEPRRYGTRLWLARLSRMWKAYLRLSVAVAGVMGAVLLLVQYFVLLPVFAFLAKRAEKGEPQGWIAADARPHSMRSQYR